MSKFIKNQHINAIWSTLKPWLSAIVLVLILQYTGALAGISFLTQSAVMKTGIMDFEPAGSEVAPSFDYNFTLKDLKGNIIDLNQLKGKVLFINLWATWCGPCRVEMPSIQRLYDDTDHDKIAFIMLSLDTEENHPKVARYVEDKGLTFPVYVPHESLPRQLRVSSIPTTFIVDTEGKIRSRKTGAANYDTEQMREFLRSLAR
jgi:thiol-disulfide isomerase/thioredoxin